MRTDSVLSRNVKCYTFPRWNGKIFICWITNWAVQSFRIRLNLGFDDKLAILPWRLLSTPSGHESNETKNNRRCQFFVTSNELYLPMHRYDMTYTANYSNGQRHANRSVSISAHRADTIEIVQTTIASLASVRSGDLCRRRDENDLSITSCLSRCCSIRCRCGGGGVWVYTWLNQSVITV